jgi:hypothetical protein
MTTSRLRIHRLLPTACLVLTTSCGNDGAASGNREGLPTYAEPPPAPSGGEAGGDGEPAENGVAPEGTDDGPGGNGSEGAPPVRDLVPSVDEPPGGGAPDADGSDPDEAGDGSDASDETPEEPAEPEPRAPQTQVFVLFGQSNMWGVPNPQSQDLEVNPRVEALTLQGCGRHGANQWVPAQPPLHGCVGQPGTGGQGPGVGPGDYFGKALAEAFPEDTILLVPNAIPGVSIDAFQPGQPAYNSTLARARMAQDRGEIRGIIFHQGETDTGQGTWPGRVKNVVDRLRADLGIGEVPFVAGELLYNPIGCCGNGHNPLVNQLPGMITRTSVASAAGFGAVPAAQDTFGNLHFDLPSQREFGRRYAQALLTALGE